MCVAAVAWDCHPELLLVAAANRDEFHDRPTSPLARWQDHRGLIAGRDLRGGGTWLGVSDRGHFALLTNFRDPQEFAEGRPSRGGVVTALLHGGEPLGIDQMNPLNAFYASPRKARFITNYPDVRKTALHGGIHGLSNGPLLPQWPKTSLLCEGLGQWLEGDTKDVEPLFAMLRSETPRPLGPAPMHAPEPGFAPVFIHNPVYGTRCSTIVTIGRDGTGLIAERSFDAMARPNEDRSFAFRWPM